MVVSEGNVAGSVKKPKVGKIKRLFQAEFMGDTPDGKWSWYSIRKLTPDGAVVESILGVVAESPERTHWGTNEPHRDYRLFFYEPSLYSEGSIPATIFKHLVDAVEYAAQHWERHQERIRLHGGETR